MYCPRYIRQAVRGLQCKCPERTCVVAFELFKAQLLALVGVQALTSSNSRNLGLRGIEDNLCHPHHFTPMKPSTLSTTLSISRPWSLRVLSPPYHFTFVKPSTLSTTLSTSRLWSLRVLLPPPSLHVCEAINPLHHPLYFTHVKSSSTVTPPITSRPWSHQPFLPPSLLYVTEASRPPPHQGSTPTPPTPIHALRMTGRITKWVDVISVEQPRSCKQLAEWYGDACFESDFHCLFIVWIRRRQSVKLFSNKNRACWNQGNNFCRKLWLQFWPFSPLAQTS